MAAASLKPIHRKPEVAIPIGIPRLYAAASLKPIHRKPEVAIPIGIPRLYAAASLKPRFVRLL